MKREIQTSLFAAPTMLALGILAAVGFSSSAANASVVEVPIERAAPVEFWSFGDDTTANPNIILDLGQGSPVVITGLGWDFAVTAEEPAMLSHFGLAVFNASGGFDPDQGDGFLGAPAEGDDFSGFGEYSTNGIVKLAEVGLNDLFLDLGFFYGELFSWSGQPGLTVSGSLAIQYQVLPAPGALALLGLAALSGSRRRR